MGIPFVTERRLLPVLNEDSWSSFYEISALYLFRKALYVGYSYHVNLLWMSSEQRRSLCKTDVHWDPRPLVLGTVLEVCNGYIHYEGAMDEGAYAQIARMDVEVPASVVRKRERRMDYRSYSVRDDLKDLLAIRHSWTLRDGECIWFAADTKAHIVEWVSPRLLMRQIRNAESLDAMRYSKAAEELRTRTHDQGTCYHNLTPTSCSNCQ